MAQQRLLSGLTPTIPNVVEGGANTVAITFVPAVDGTLDGVEFLTTDTISGTYGVAAWAPTADDSPAETGAGNLIGSKSASPSGTNTMQTVLFDAPIAIVADAPIRVGLRTSEGRYAATGAYFNAQSRTVGDLTAPQTGTNGYANGTFIESATAYPTKTFNGNLYFVGPIFTASSDIPPEEHTSTGTASATASASAAVASRHVSDGSAAALAAATATVAPRRASTGTAAALASARADVTPRRVSTGTARAVAAGGNYTAGGAPGPWLTSRRRQGRIVSRTQVAR